MDALRVVVFLVRCADSLLLCDDLPSTHLYFSSMEHCRSALPFLVDEAAAPAAVVMGRCRYLLIESRREDTAQLR